MSTHTQAHGAYHGSITQHGTSHPAWLRGGQRKLRRRDLRFSQRSTWLPSNGELHRVVRQHRLASQQHQVLMARRYPMCRRRLIATHTHLHLTCSATADPCCRRHRRRLLPLHDLLNHHRNTSALLQVGKAQDLRGARHVHRVASHPHGSRGRCDTLSAHHDLGIHVLRDVRSRHGILRLPPSTQFARRLVFCGGAQGNRGSILSKRSRWTRTTGHEMAGTYAHHCDVPRGVSDEQHIECLEGSLGIKAWPVHSTHDALHFTARAKAGTIQKRLSFLRHCRCCSTQSREGHHTDAPCDGTKGKQCAFSTDTNS